MMEMKLSRNLRTDEAMPTDLRIDNTPPLRLTAAEPRRRQDRRLHDNSAVLAVPRAGRALSDKMAIILMGLMSLVFILMAASLADAQEQAVHGKLPLMKLEEVTNLIMSPGCSYIYTLTLCPSSEADQMRELVKDKLIAGETSDQILDYFAEIYGPRVLAQPAKKGFYLVAWWFPYFLIFDVILIAGVILMVWRKKAIRMESDVSEDDLDAQASEIMEVEDLLEEEVRRFREE